MNPVKRRIRTGLLAIVLLLTMAVFSPSALADEDAIAAIDIDVSLQPDGSAEITQVWEIVGISSGTEYFIPFSSGTAISGFTVTDSSGTQYASLADWDTGASFEEKAYKSGINYTSDGLELCWGMSTMGDNIYTLHYRMEHFVLAYEDGDGFYTRLVNPGLSSPPDTVSVRIHMDGVQFGEANAEIYAMGFAGQIQFVDGDILAWSTDGLNGNQYVNILCGFTGGIFSAQGASGTFEAVKSRALEKSEPVSTASVVLISCIGAALVIGIFALIIAASRKVRLADGTKVPRYTKKTVELSSSVPFEGSIPGTVFMITLGGAWGVTQYNAFSAYLVKWELDGVITYEEDEKGRGVLQLTSTKPGPDAPGDALYALLQHAAGGSNTLPEKTFTKWAAKHERAFADWNKTVNEFGEQLALTKGWAAKNAKGKTKLTQQGLTLSGRMYGFHLYLKELAQGRDNAGSTSLWGDYLVFATLFDQTKNVLKGMSQIDDGYVNSLFGSREMDMIMMLHFINMTHSVSSASGSSGAGGSAMSSGGGGFSGGSSGGGSR